MVLATVKYGVLEEKRKALWQPNAEQNIQDFFRDIMSLHL